MKYHMCTLDIAQGFPYTGWETSARPLANASV